jgi:TonB-linked SusC/RagA family outer membrane protein
MKLTVLLLTITCLQVSASSYAQQVTLKEKNVPLEKVFKQIHQQTGYQFVYGYDLLQQAKKVTIDAVNEPLTKVLEICFRDQPFTYVLTGKAIIVKRKPAAVSPPAEVPAPVQLTGRVTDSLGNPLVGVTVQEKTGQSGTVTDATGHYAITVPDDAVLIVSYIGYVTIEVPVQGRKEINIVLKQAVSSLNQLVVVGYGTTKKKDLTGAVSVINPDDIRDIPVGGVDQIMQGKASGVAITEQTGAPGAPIAVRIRGVGTINNNDPLYIIDGVPTKDGINEIAPGDIESINILKDASSAAIYGSRASNGVVIITTKQGKSGKARLSFSNYTGIQTHGHLIKMANTKQYVKAFNTAAITDGRPQIPAGMLDTLPDVNWLKEILQPALITNTQLSVSGGNENSRYIVSANYFKQKGLIENSAFQRFNIHTGVTSRLSKMFRIGTNINLAYAKRKEVGSSGDGYGSGNPGASVVRYALFRTPATPVYNKAGQFVDLPNPTDFFGDGYNPVGYADTYDRNYNAYTLLGNAYLEFNPIAELTLKSDIGINLILNDYKQFFQTWGIDRFINSPNSLAQSSNHELNYNWTNTATYHLSLGDQNELTILAGTEAVKDDVQGMSASRQHYVDQSNDFRYLDNGLSNQLNGGNESHWALFSLFGRIGYQYADKYLVNFNMRRDGSSRLSKGNQYGNFYSGSAGWRIDKENFMKSVKQISLLKLRVSVGQLGNQDIGNYPYASIVSGGFYYPFGGTPTEGYTITSKGNPEVKWETSTQTDVGLDLGLFNDALQVTADYFIKNTSNMLLSIPEPSSAGSAGSPTENAGKVKNNGLELEVTYSHEVNRKLAYKLTGNFATLHNEVTSLAGGKPIAGGRIDNNYYATLTTVGHPIGAFYLVQDVGIFQTPLDVITPAYQGPNKQPGGM